MNKINFNRYFIIFLVATFVAPTIYFYSIDINLNYPLETFSVVIIGYLSFSYAYKFISRKSNADLTRPKNIKTIKFFTQIFITAVLIFSSFMIFLPLRLRYSIGLPDFGPSTEYAGILYYLSTFTVQSALLSSFMISSRNKKNYFVLSFGFICYSVYEALLGWRIGLLESLILLTIARNFIVSNNIHQNPNFLESDILKNFLFAILTILVLALVVQVVLYLQLQMRNPTGEYLIDALIFRFWGAGFLDNIISYFLNNNFDIITNDFHYLYLLSNDISVAQFNNVEIHGGVLDQHHGNSKSGFGSVYIFGGIIWVLLSYGIAGLYFGLVKNLMMRTYSISLITIGSMHLPLLFRIINEQFELGTITIAIAIWIFGILGVIFTQSFRKMSNIRIK